MSNVFWEPSQIFRDRHLEELRQAVSSGVAIARFCFHADEASRLHVMLIRMRAEESYPVHMHTNTDEWYFILSGSLTINEFERGGRLLRTTILRGPRISPEASDIDAAGGMLMGSERWHSTVSGQSGAVFLEVRNGPFSPSSTLFFDEL